MYDFQGTKEAGKRYALPRLRPSEYSDRRLCGVRSGRPGEALTRFPGVPPGEALRASPASRQGKR